MRKINVFLFGFMLLVLVSCAATYNTTDTASKTTESAPTAATTVQNTESPVAPSVPSQEQPVTEEQLSPVETKGSLEAVDSGAEVAGYRVKGHSEEGDNFDWISVQSSQIVLSNITQGHWTLDIQAVDKDGNVLYSGKVVKELSKEMENNTETVQFVKNTSAGSAKIEYRWNAALVNAPQLEVWVKKVGDKEYKQCPKSEITPSTGGATWYNPALAEGSYIVKAILKDSKYVISGVATALHIYEALESTGTAILQVNPFVANLDLSELTKNPINITLSLEHETIIANGGEDLSYTWFVDGLEIENTTNTLNAVEVLTNGQHRIDCIAIRDNAVCSAHIFVKKTDDTLIGTNTNITTEPIVPKEIVL